MSTNNNSTLDGMYSGQITVSGTLNYVVEDSDSQSTSNNNYPDNLSEASTVPKNETFVLYGVEDSGNDRDEGVEESKEEESDDDDIMEISIRELMEDKARGEKVKPRVEQVVEEQEMEVDVSPAPQTSRMLSLIKKYGPTGDLLRKIEEPSGIKKQESRG